QRHCNSLQQVACGLIDVSDHTLRPDPEEDGDGCGADQRDADSGGNFGHRCIDVTSGLTHVHHYDYAQIVICGDSAVDHADDGEPDQFALQCGAEDVELGEE